jgi:hypothetical protein
MSVADIQGWRPRFRISYGALLLILVAILLLMPPMVEAGYGLLIMSTLFPALFVVGLFSVIEHRRVRLAALPLAVLVIVGDVLVLAFDVDLPLATRFIDIFFMILVASAILADVARSERVTSDTILGGICAYLLIGMFFFMLYSSIELLTPGSFVGVEGRVTDAVGGARPLGRYPELLYFSLVTMTTLGYGDITPAGSLPRVLAAAEAVIGQLFVAILIARLVGLQVSQGRPGGRA